MRTIANKILCLQLYLFVSPTTSSFPSTASCQKNDNVRAVDMHTRSKGPVVELSNVQEETLEYSTKKRSHNYFIYVNKFVDCVSFIVPRYF